MSAEIQYKVLEERYIIPPSELANIQEMANARQQHVIVIPEGSILGICRRGTIELVPKGELGVCVMSFVENSK